MSSRFNVGDRVKLSDQGRDKLRPGWSVETGTVVLTGLSWYDDIIVVRRDNQRVTGLCWAGYWELDNMVGYAGSSSTISVSDLSNKR